MPRQRQVLKFKENLLYLELCPPYWGGDILFCPRLSVRLFVCLSVHHAICSVT